MPETLNCNLAEDPNTENPDLLKRAQNTLDLNPKPLNPKPLNPKPQILNPKPPKP